MLRRARSYLLVSMLVVAAVMIATASELDARTSPVAASAAPSARDAAIVHDLAGALLTRSEPLPSAVAAAPAVTPAPTEAPASAHGAAATATPASERSAPAPRTPVPAVATTAPQQAAPAQAAAASCPSDWFCYPRLGVAGAIVPYSDCSGSTDVGTSIRAFLCLSPNYLLGHAYTQMGKITGWQAGDQVVAYGRTFTVYGAITEQSCQPPTFPLAPLSMQTSLSPYTCGPVLVVQAR